MLQVEITQDALQARMEATAEDVRAFARGYAASVETHCLMKVFDFIYWISNKNLRSELQQCDY